MLTALGSKEAEMKIIPTGLQAATQKLEEHRPAVAQPLHSETKDAHANVTAPSEQPASETAAIQ
jgi:hypothetical protein